MINKRVITVGRYSTEKGYEYLLRAWQLVEQKHPDWHLDFYGADSGDKNRLDSIRESLDVNNVRLNGPVIEIKEEYLNSSIFAMSSINEGFPMVLTEAMVCGLPCVAFDCKNGPSEIICDGEDGIVIPRIRDYHTLADGICTLIENDDLRKQMGGIAKENIKRFELPIIMHQWEELLNKVIQDKE